ncbi:MAG: CvpA family protein [Acidobacteriota bacterium]
MNWLDVVLGLILAASMVAGLVKGFARSLIGFVAVIFGLFFGLWFHGTVGAFFYEYVSSKELAHFIGFVILFFGILLLGALLAAMLAKALKWAQLSWLDRLAGGGFGLLRGALVGAAIVLAIMAFAPKPPPQSVANSRLAPYVVEAGDVLVAAAPFEVKQGFRRSYERIQQLWKETLDQRLRKPPEEKL